jgi:hypothetical protein
MSNKPKSKKTKSAKNDREPSRERNLERDLDEALEETFPASDPVAMTDPVVDVLKGRRKNKSAHA